MICRVKCDSPLLLSNSGNRRRKKEKELCYLEMPLILTRLGNPSSQQDSGKTSCCRNTRSVMVVDVRKTETFEKRTIYKLMLLNIILLLVLTSAKE
jgi:hypothetical protein